MRLEVKPCTGPMRGRARVPGDKSIGHRAVLFGALGDGCSRVRGLSGGEDNARTVGLLEALGVRIERKDTHSLDVYGRGLAGLRASAGPLECGNSGTTMRLCAGLLAGVPGRHVLAGDEYLHRRPMRRVAAPLREMGALLEGAAGAKPGELYPPLVIDGKRPLGGLVHVCEVASAQVKSAVLLAGLSADGVVTVREPGPSRDHTERMLRARGVPLTVDGLQATLDPRGWDRRLAALDVDVPGDPSSSAFLAVAAAIVAGSELRIEAVLLNDTRTGFVDALSAMGAEITVEDRRDTGGEPTGTLLIRAAALRGTTIAGELVVRALDELPVLAVAAACAEGTTVIRDASELRVKESDRVATTVRMLRALGVAADERPDGMIIEGRAGRPLSAGRVESAGDHRIAMCGAVAALIADGECAIDDADNVRTSFPSFVGTLRALGAELSEESA